MHAKTANSLNDIDNIILTIRLKFLVSSPTSNFRDFMYVSAHAITNSIKAYMLRSIALPSIRLMFSHLKTWIQTILSSSFSNSLISPTYINTR